MLRLIGGLLIVLCALVPAVALADAVASTGNATSITQTSAELHGVIDPTYSDNAWTFEYSTAPDFSVNPQVTHPQAAGSGTQAVSAAVSGLKPNTTYYYRVAVYWQSGTGSPSYRMGNTVSFTTLSPPPKESVGRVTVSGSALAVRHGSALVKMRCGYGAAKKSLCLSKLTLTAPIGRHHARVTCGTGKFGAWAPAAQTVKIPLAKPCLAALRAARRHRLKATLHAVFLGAQPLSRAVTLRG